jgi:hypothetical protein
LLIELMKFPLLNPLGDAGGMETGVVEHGEAYEYVPTEPDGGFVHALYFKKK